jgi:hypothetical protein
LIANGTLNDVVRECSNTKNSRERALNLGQTNIAVCAFALAALLSAGVTTAPTATSLKNAAGDGEK